MDIGGTFTDLAVYDAALGTDGRVA